MSQNSFAGNHEPLRADWRHAFGKLSVVSFKAVIGQTISHYRVVAKASEGGMGVVYKAEDTKLGRTVALKFLAAHLLKDEESRKRFEREAKAAAALNHPNICTIHEIDEVNGRTFLALEFVEGDSLEKKIERGPLALKEALDIGRQVADGLHAAHQKKIVHRDIKPGNLLITPEGRVKILDFGLALLTEDSRLTQLDTTLGTVAYMSPQQAQGVEVDHRTDIWALGCVLYEMVCGQRPFKGVYDKALLYEIVYEEPQPLTGLRTGVPVELEFMIGKCLAKDAAQRYQNSAEIIVDLGNLAQKLKSGGSTILKTAAGPGDKVGTGSPAGPGQAESLSLPGNLTKRYGKCVSHFRMEAASTLGPVRHHRYCSAGARVRLLLPAPSRSAAAPICLYAGVALRDDNRPPAGRLRRVCRGSRDLSQWQAHCLCCSRGGKQALGTRSRS